MAITDAEINESHRTLEKALTGFVSATMNIRGDRDQATYVIDTLIANMKRQVEITTVAEGDNAGGELLTAISHWLDYARDQRSRLP